MPEHRAIDIHPHPRVGPLDPGEPLPSVRTVHAPEAVLARLEALARRGKLPGFAPLRGRCGFEVEVFAEPFDRVLTGEVEAQPGGTTLIQLHCRARRRMPIILAIAIVLMIWPGVWLMDSMLRTYFQGYSWPTWAWYIPLTVLPLPWMARKWIKKSDALARQSRQEQIARIVEGLDGSVVREPAPSPASAESPRDSG